MQSSTTSFVASTKTYAIATSTSGSTGVQVVGTQGTGALNTATDQYYVVNASAGFLFFTLTPETFTAIAPSAGNSAAGYVLPPNSGGTFGGPRNAFFSGDLDTGSGVAYVCGGNGL